ncbi:MAG: DDE-type integrase/transposase/recombinase [Steroidobacteraceae bacterium]
MADVRKIRTLTTIDLFTRECLGIEVGFSLRANDVAAAMNRPEYSRGLPQSISCDNGPEFAGGQIDLWAYTHKVQMDFTRALSCSALAITRARLKAIVAIELGTWRCIGAFYDPQA